MNESFTSVFYLIQQRQKIQPCSFNRCI